MPRDEQYDWPSFKTVLRDVATSDGTENNDRPEPSSTTIAEGSDVLLSEPDSFDSGSSDLIDLLPEPLAPVDFDTSAVRALLEPIADNTHETFELDALEPLAPVVEPQEDQADAGPFELPSVFDLAFDPDAAFDPDTHQVSGESTAIDDSATLGSSIIDDVGGIEIPADTSTNTEVFEDLGIASEISLDDVPEFAAESEAPNSPSPFDDPHTADVPGVAVFELDASTIADEETDGAETAFDSVATANAIEGELNELSDLTGLGPQDPTEMFGLDNVIPLHPEVDDASASDDPGATSTEWVNPIDESAHDGPPRTRVSHTGWVGLEANETEETVQEEDPDPWAHMRPTEEPKPEGFWAKVFGGEERKKAKARRLAKQNAATQPAAAETHHEVESAFDTSCPNCGGQCQVDLDDPIGRRVHVSCPECDHMWNTPYLDETG